ncbi:stage II sporulation protein M [Paenibacillus thermotolerans]|uniref:stage II sporulation protein M n=1 Tax=Paenibacillus thermotolerans TaxID=3027807 RepID=UPI002367463A|nr:MULTISPECIES: stage II sporulation protein M [unclassified Paenibacillus]
MKRMQSVFRVYSKEQLPLYMFVCVLFIMGVVFGALLVNALTLEQKQEVSQYLNTFLQSQGKEAASGGPVSLLESFGVHFKWVLLIYLLGLSVVGVPIILVLDFLKGVLIGFTVGYLAGQWSWKGMLLALASVAPQNLIVVPAIMICSVAAISFSFLLVRSRLLNRSNSAGRPFAAFSGVCLALCGLLFIVALFESYVSPSLLAWVTPLVLEGV